MTTIPTVPIPTGNAAPQGASATVTVEQLTAALAKLPPGTTVRAVVTAMLGGGEIQLKTDQGSLTIRTTLDLPVDSSVRLQVQGAGSQAKLLVLTADPGTGKTAGAAGPHMAGAAIRPDVFQIGARAADTVSLTPSGAPRPLALGQVVPATLSPVSGDALARILSAAPPPAPGSTAPATAAPSAPSGSVALTVRIIGLQAPGAASPVTAAAPAPIPAQARIPAQAPAQTATATTPGSVPPSAGAVPPAAAAAAGPPPAAPPSPVSTSAAPAPPGIQAAATGTTVPAPQPGSMPGAALAAIAGRVVAGAAQGLTIETPLGALRLAGVPALPDGTRVAVEIVTAQAPTARASPGGIAPTVPFDLLAEWPALKSTVADLDRTHPALGQAVAEHVAARPDSKLGGAMLLFMSALKLGDPRLWLDPSLRTALERAGHGDAVSRLSDDFGRMSRLAADPGADWRGFLIPIHDGDQFRQIRMFVRDRDNGRRSAEDREDRFLIDLDLSRLGEMQLDGLLQGRKFHLIVRTKATLAPDMQGEIARIFDDACGCTGIAGNLVFAGQAALIPLPLPRPSEPDGGLTA